MGSVGTGWGRGIARKTSGRTGGTVKVRAGGARGGVMSERGVREAREGEVGGEVGWAQWQA